MLSNPLGSALVTGFTAEVYAWNQGQVLKLFHTSFPLVAIEHEARVARVVHNAGFARGVAPMTRRGGVHLFLGTDRRGEGS
jgi:hypothetical protein